MAVDPVAGEAAVTRWALARRDEAANRRAGADTAAARPHECHEAPGIRGEGERPSPLGRRSDRLKLRAGCPGGRREGRAAALTTTERASAARWSGSGKEPARGDP